MIEIQSGSRENLVHQPAEEKAQKQNQGGRSVGKRLIDSKKIGKIVNEGKGENKKQYSPLCPYCTEHKNSKKNREQG